MNPDQIKQIITDEIWAIRNEIQGADTMTEIKALKASLKSLNRLLNRFAEVSGVEELPKLDMKELYTRTNRD